MKALCECFVRFGQCRQDDDAVPAAPWPGGCQQPHGRQQRGAGQAPEPDLRGACCVHTAFSDPWSHLPLEAAWAPCSLQLGSLGCCLLLAVARPMPSAIHEVDCQLASGQCTCTLGAHNRKHCSDPPPLREAVLWGRENMIALAGLGPGRPGEPAAVVGDLLPAHRLHHHGAHLSVARHCIALHAQTTENMYSIPANA